MTSADWITQIKSMGISIVHYSRSSAATPLIFLFLLASFFVMYFASLYSWIIYIWVIILLLYIFLFVFAFLFQDHKLRGEDYNLQMKKLELEGDKDTGLSLPSSEPLLQATTISSRIGKKNNTKK